MQTPFVGPTWLKPPPIPPHSKSNTCSHAPRPFLAINAYNDNCQLLKTYCVLNIVLIALNVY